MATSGAVHVEAVDPSIVDVREVEPGIIGIRGVRPGDTAIVVLTAADVLVWPVHVTPAPILPSTPVAGPGGVLDALYQPLPNPAIAGLIEPVCDDLGPGAAFRPPWTCAQGPGANWAALFERGDVQGAFAAGSYNLDVHPRGGIQVVVASYLPTPLDPFGSPPTWGIDTRAPWGTEVIDSPVGVEVLQHFRIANGDVFGGMTYLGPLAGIQLSFRPVELQVSTLASGGQVLAAGALGLRAGDVSVSYIASPIGNGIIVRLTQSPLDLAVSVGSSETDVGVAYTFSGGQSVQGFWSSVNGFQVVYVAPLGEAVTRTTVVAGQPEFSATLEPTGGPQITTVPVGPGSLTLTPVLLWGRTSSAHLRMPLAGPAAPEPLAPLAPAAPAGTLIVRACVNSRRDDTCTQSDPALLITVLVDGTPVTMSGTGVSVPAGSHRVAVPLEAVPPLLVPLKGLTCDLTIPAFGVGVCELPFRREGAP
ncbi:MAG TPA: hypothetical protein VEW91_03985 [bacterium]|nr:hypothetical protein [bacterium]